MVDEETPITEKEIEPTLIAAQSGQWKPALVVPGTLIVIVIFLWLGGTMLDECVRAYQQRSKPPQSTRGSMPFVGSGEAGGIGGNPLIAISFLVFGIPTIFAVTMSGILAFVTGKRMFYYSLGVGCVALCMFLVFVA